MLKLIGAVLVISACSGIGYFLSRRLSLHVTALLWVKKMVIMLKGEILYMNAPLEEAFDSVAKRMPAPYSEFLESVAKELSERHSKPFFEVWCEGITAYLQDSNLAQADLIELREMGENLGYLDRHMQEKTLNLYMSQLEERMEYGKSECAEKSKIYRTLGIMAGIFITIVMI